MSEFKDPIDIELAKILREAEEVRLDAEEVGELTFKLPAWHLLAGRLNGEESQYEGVTYE